MNHWYNPEDEKLYFHGAKTGHKIDAITKDNRVSYCVHDAGYQKEGEWALNISSVANFYGLIDGVQKAFRGTVMVNYTIVIVPQGSWLM